MFTLTHVDDEEIGRACRQADLGSPKVGDSHLEAIGGEISREKQRVRKRGLHHKRSEDTWRGLDLRQKFSSPQTFLCVTKFRPMGCAHQFEFVRKGPVRLTFL